MKSTGQGQAVSGQALLGEPPIFVVGSGRSGTTLMRSLLSAHSRIVIAPETHYMKLAERRVGLDAGSAETVSGFWNEYVDNMRFQDLGVDPNRCLELADRAGGPVPRNLFEAMLEAFRQKSGKPRVGEKTPSHIRWIDDLLAWFPNARIVAMRRDPRAIIASQIASPWVHQHFTPVSVRTGMVTNNRIHEVSRLTEDWVDLYETILPAWKDDPRVMVVDYESLVTDSADILESVCDFLGERFEIDMLADRNESTVPAPTGSAPNKELNRWREDHYKKTLAPVSAASLDKWRNELSAVEVSLIEGRCAAGMRDIGYDRQLGAAGRTLGRLLQEAVTGIGRVENHARDRARSVVRGMRSMKNGDSS